MSGFNNVDGIAFEIEQSVGDWIEAANRINHYCVKNNIPIVFCGSLQAESLQPNFIESAYKSKINQWRDIDILPLRKLSIKEYSDLQEIAGKFPVEDISGDTYFDIDIQNGISNLIYKKITVPLNPKYLTPHINTVHGVSLPFLDPFVAAQLFGTIGFAERFRDFNKRLLYLNADSSLTELEKEEVYDTFELYKKIRRSKYPKDSILNTIRGHIPAPKNMAIRRLSRGIFKKINSSKQEVAIVPTFIARENIATHVGSGKESNVSKVGKLIIKEIIKDDGELNTALALVRDINRDYFEFQAIGMTESELPPTHFVIAENPETKVPKMYGFQEFKGDRMLKDFSLLELFKNKELRAKLSELLRKICVFYEDLGFMPDTVGVDGFYIGKQRFPDLRNLFPNYSTNIVVDDDGNPSYIDYHVNKTQNTPWKIRSLIQYYTTKTFGMLINPIYESIRVDSSSMYDLSAQSLISNISKKYVVPKNIHNFENAYPLKDKRILIVTTSTDKVNGITFLNKMLIDFILANGGTPVILTPGLENTIECLNGIEIHRVRSFGNLEDRMLVPKSTKWIDNCINDRIDGAILINPTVLGILASLRLESKNISTIAIAGTRFESYLRAELPKPIGKTIADIVKELDKRVKNLLPVKRWIAPSQSYMEHLTKRGVKNIIGLTQDCPNNKIDISEEDIQKFKNSLAPNGEIVLSFVGNISFVKNFNFLLKIVNQLRNKNVRFKLLAVGNISKDIKDIILNNPILLESISFVGPQHGPALSLCYSSSDLFIFPSYSETLGYVTQEALKHNLPVVAAKSIGTSDLIKDGVNGTLLAAHRIGDLQKWVELISTLSINRDELHRLKKQAHPLKDNVYNWREHNVKLFEELFR